MSFGNDQGRAVRELCPGPGRNVQHRRLSGWRNFGAIERLLGQRRNVGRRNYESSNEGKQSIVLSHDLPPRPFGDSIVTVSLSAAFDAWPFFPFGTTLHHMRGPARYRDDACFTQ